MSDALPNTGLTGDFNTVTAESGWGALMNTDLRIIDVLMQARVINRTLATPPASPADGDMYIVPTGATAAWAGQDNRLAVWRVDLGTWMFITPRAGWIVTSLADAYQQYRYTTSWGLYTAPAAVGIQTLDGGTTIAGITTLVVDNGTLTDQGSGVARLAFAADGVGTPNHQTVSSYTAVMPDIGRLTLMDVATANGFVVPDDADLNLPLGAKLKVNQFNVGTTSISGETGDVILHLAPGKTLMCSGRYGQVVAEKIAANEWILTGDFAGASALVFNAKTADYTLALADGLDGRQCISNTDTAAHVLTIPPHSAVPLPVGQQIYGMASGAGSSWNIVAGTGVTIVSLGAVPAAPVASSVGLPFVMTQTAQDVWAVQGPIA